MSAALQIPPPGRSARRECLRSPVTGTPHGTALVSKTLTPKLADELAKVAPGADAQAVLDAVLKFGRVAG